MFVIAQDKIDHRDKVDFLIIFELHLLQDSKILGGPTSNNIKMLILLCNAILHCFLQCSYYTISLKITHDSVI